MAEKKAVKSGEKAGKKPGKQLSKLYIITGDKIQRKNKHCPKCGQGTFLGAHKDRVVCGKCRYVEYVSRK